MSCTQTEIQHVLCGISNIFQTIKTFLKNNRTEASWPDANCLRDSRKKKSKFPLHEWILDQNFQNIILIKKKKLRTAWPYSIVRFLRKFTSICLFYKTMLIFLQNCAQDMPNSDLSFSSMYIDIENWLSTECLLRVESLFIRTDRHCHVWCKF